MSPNAGGGVAGSQPMSTAVHRNPNKPIYLLFLLLLLYRLPSDITDGQGLKKHIFQKNYYFLQFTLQ
jgi:hypothetical protein